MRIRIKQSQQQRIIDLANATGKAPTDVITDLLEKQLEAQKADAQTTNTDIS